MMFTSGTQSSSLFEGQWLDMNERLLRDVMLCRKLPYTTGEMGILGRSLVVPLI